MSNPSDEIFSTSPSEIRLLLERQREYQEMVGDLLEILEAVSRFFPELDKELGQRGITLRNGILIELREQIYRQLNEAFRTWQRVRKEPVLHDA